MGFLENILFSFVKPGSHIISIRRRPIGITTPLRSSTAGDSSATHRRQGAVNHIPVCISNVSAGFFCFFGKQKRSSNKAAISRLACNGHLITRSMNNLLANRRLVFTYNFHWRRCHSRVTKLNSAQLSRMTAAGCRQSASCRR